MKDPLPAASDALLEHRATTEQLLELKDRELRAYRVYEKYLSFHIYSRTFKVINTLINRIKYRKTNGQVPIRF